ncbi:MULTISPECIES: histidine phosphatase family protein [unclassified Paenibacillus]|uniref:histidine phosphatase family protein n=1 Tax=unclassified Paenibacillus TaxID=185978 RepID=UPI0008B06BB2|nr:MULTISPECIES: histidine phosphatase family protein [unclassified Paenibacillus]QLG41253.1 histidine phosphatase family protein [Paenibacillus sp. E222]SEN32953.1 probable phosphoglycerate mutase [Paenibacillus sp. OK076]
MATIALIRHGSTSWNKEGRAQGNSDISLDQDGINQAELLATRLRSEDWNHIYSSTLARAKQTALIVGSAIGVDIHLDDRLRERSGGLIEGTTEEERIEKWGTGWIELDLGLEPIEKVQKRGEEFLEEIMMKHQGEKVLVVSHGALIQFNFINLVPDFPTKDFGNTSITILKKIDNQWTCELHNCTKHLEGNIKEG